ncbi:uncharacterized protein J4E79_007482 [Alternaria viburni]|uniref:uncharacterized protein n=1 Tax=Alternaria viburni TaxID=566460 RepID=UPI0020C37BB2|nr:uncharacterized protein J4E79_007482 [Alternaria viburni]KAI4657409.1 hypothetical protein J4E79_007482 [Alternaria viburni]
MPSRESETPTAIDKKPTLSQEDKDDKDKEEVARLKRRITGEFDGRYVELVLMCTSVDLLRTLSFDGSEESSCLQGYEIVDEKNGDLNITKVYFMGTKEVRFPGSAEPDVVNAHVKLLKQIEAEKSSKQ